MPISGEVWRVIPGCEGRYKISNKGRFWITRDTNRGGRTQYAGIDTGDKYRCLILEGGKRTYAFTGVLVLEAFVGPRPGHPRKYQACHKDDNRDNNEASNLYWGNASTNKLDAVRNGVANIPKGSRHRDAKLTEDIVLEARELRRMGWSVASLARRYGVTGGPMSLALRGITWKHLNTERGD